MKKQSNPHDTTDMAAEPIAATFSGVRDISRVGRFSIPDEMDPGVGPYTMDEIDKQLQEAEETLRSPKQWSTLQEILSDFKQEHVSWFR